MEGNAIKDAIPNRSAIGNAEPIYLDPALARLLGHALLSAANSIERWVYSQYRDFPETTVELTPEIHEAVTGGTKLSSGKRYPKKDSEPHDSIPEQAKS